MKYTVLLAALLAFSLSACGKKEEAMPAPEAAAPAVEAPAGALPRLLKPLPLKPLPLLLTQLLRLPLTLPRSRCWSLISKPSERKPAFGPVFFVGTARLSDDQISPALLTTATAPLAKPAAKHTTI